MLPENIFPSLQWLAPPASYEDAAVRILELAGGKIDQAPLTRLTLSVFKDIEQLKRGLKDSGNFISKEKELMVSGPVKTFELEITQKNETQYKMIATQYGDYHLVVNNVRLVQAPSETEEDKQALKTFKDALFVEEA